MTDAVHAYGAVFTGLPASPWLTTELPAGAPRIAVGRAEGLGTSVLVHVAERRAVVAADVPFDEVVHPHLGRIVLAFAGADGREGLHAGAVLLDGAAWAVVGGTLAGKSTLLAALAQRGVPVLADDVLVLDRGDVLAGPRCLDLRHRPPATPATPVRAGAKWRLALGPAPLRAPLRGLVHLAWGDAPAVRELDAGAVLARLAARQEAEGFPRDPRVVLDLLGLAQLELVRPRELAALDASLDALVAAVARRSRG